MLKRASFRTRLVLGAAMLILTILVMVFYARGLIDDSTEESIDTTARMGVMNNYLAQVKNNLLDIERHIYQQAVNPDINQRQRFDEKVSGIEDLLRASKRFLNEYLREHQPHDHPVKDINAMLKLSDTIESVLNKVSQAGDEYFGISENLSRRYPGMRVLTEELLPNNNRFIEACDLAISESNLQIKSQHQAEIRSLFQNIRYAWAQQISWVRLFIANRSGVFGEAQQSMKMSLENRALYAAQVKNYINELSEYKDRGMLDLQQSLSFDEITTILVEYESDFKKARAEYVSKNWRADLVQLHGELNPLIEQMWGFIRTFENTINEHAKLAVNLSQNAVNQSGTFVWGVGLIALAMIVITYFLFDIILRRPILQVARALDAEAAGHDIDINLNHSVAETELLIKAFRNMQNQVHQRQTRLESILDNAAEGIVTINESGVVETFNTAAQALFGYSAEEVIGNNVSMLVPEPHRSRHNQYLFDYKTHGKESVIGVTREVSAQRKNGTTFPMSLKVSEMYIDGKRHFNAVVEDISDRKALIQNLRNLAEHDSLTGLYNRLFFSEELEKVVTKKLRGDQNQIALLYIDLDNFKYVNDTMGHLAGDQLLVEVGSILKSNTRDTDLLARLGGDEFAVILFRAGPDHILQAAERFRNSIEEYVFLCSGKTVNIGCSIGVAELTEKICDKDQLLSRADIACAEAKKRGRNIVHVFNEDDETKLSVMSSDIGWAGKIKHAITKDEFVLAGQPIVNIESEAAEFYEILLRLNSEEGLIMPAGFFPAAERFGLLADVDRWVIRHTLALLSQLKMTSEETRLSINLSASILEDANIVDFVKRQLDFYEISPASLLFEVTESVAIANLRSASHVLGALREFGCTTALDDFGVGYSSFTYLKELPVDFVKIDGSFVRDIEDNHLSLAFVRSMNDIAHAMGKKTIAEFVETRGAMEELRAIGVDYAQGYLLGKPELFDQELHDNAVRIKRSA